VVGLVTLEVAGLNSNIFELAEGRGVVAEATRLVALVLGVLERILILAHGTVAQVVGLVVVVLGLHLHDDVVGILGQGLLLVLVVIVGGGPGLRVVLSVLGEDVHLVALVVIALRPGRLVLADRGGALGVRLRTSCFIDCVEVDFVIIIST
jgi:hypothetical protein